MTLLELNGIDATAISDDDVYELVMEVTASDHDVAEIAGRLRRLARA